MVIIAITRNLDKKLKKKFDKTLYVKIRAKFLELKKDPYKGKVLHVLGNVLLKELKFKTFRFYFLTSHNLFKILSRTEIEKELITFIEMSRKNDQVKVIQKILDSIRNNKDFE